MVGKLAVYLADDSVAPTAVARAAMLVEKKAAVSAAMKVEMLVTN